MQSRKEEFNITKQYDYMVLYLKKDGTVLKKYRNTRPPYFFGEETSMGWIYLALYYRYKDDYYDWSVCSKLKQFKPVN